MTTPKDPVRWPTEEAAREAYRHAWGPGIPGYIFRFTDTLGGWGYTSKYGPWAQYCIRAKTFGQAVINWRADGSQQFTITDVRDT